MQWSPGCCVLSCWHCLCLMQEHQQALLQLQLLPLPQGA
jgi:hypothetical protein